MKNFIVTLSQAEENVAICGNKAASLGKITNNALKVPNGICLTGNAYHFFIEETGIDKLIVIELSRKKFEDMRWEELWDASLRIRNLFVTTKIPQPLENEIIVSIDKYLKNKTLAIRSSSLNEDSPDASFAGIHESFVNISTPEKIIESIKLVWASLWSDAALLYRDEISLSIEKSAMAVIIQEMIVGEVSGIAFCESPNNQEEAIIESVFGLNKGLVDGDIEPDRFFINRSTKKISSFTLAEHKRKVSPTINGVKFVNLTNDHKESLNKQQISDLFTKMEKLEKLFDSPQDIEWTIKKVKPLFFRVGQLLSKKVTKNNGTLA
jgi:phosphoenolpyruvate synthase/pyruvate phosphate dikinase